MRRIVFFTVCLMTAFPCLAGIITVDDNNPADFNNIQAAINDANNGDIVIVQPGTYTGMGNRDIDFLGKAITVRSIDPSDLNCVKATIIDCQGIETEYHRGFIFHSDEEPNSIISGLTIKNGYTEYGGGIYCTGYSSPTIEYCVITGNSAWTGGGICTEEYGHCSPKIKNCLIYNNFAYDNCEFPCQGGFGGGIYFGGDLGGGWGCENYTPCYPEIINCTIAYNSADLVGGGVYSTLGCDVTITNSIIWDNTAANDNNVSIGLRTDVCNPIMRISYSDIQGGLDGIEIWYYVIWGSGNIDVEPLFANADDYHLRSEAGRWDPNTQSWVIDSNTSPCIDAGDSNSDWTSELWPHGKRINMGAYGGTPQASMSLYNVGNIADLDNDGDVDFSDVKLFTGKWLYQEVLLAEDLDRNGDVNFPDFSIFGNEWSKENAEASITYQISPCGVGPLAVKGLDATRFTVTVNGHYIHFEDIMTANCCPDKLELEMEVYGNQIVIYEREFLTFPCYCICDYPIEADLGPFKPGTYTLSVYEDWGDFIGSITVIIE